MLLFWYNKHKIKATALQVRPGLQSSWAVPTQLIPWLQVGC